MNQRQWLKGLNSREWEFPRWHEVASDGRWDDWWDALYECIDWPDDGGQVEAGQESLS